MAHIQGLLLAKWVSRGARGTASPVSPSAQPWYQRTLYPHSIPHNKGTCSTGLETGCKPILFLLDLAWEGLDECSVGSCGSESSGWESLGCSLATINL